jgi:hypothetical protein
MQVTVRKAQIEKKSKRLEDAARRRIYDALDEVIDYLSFNVPVDTGAYANSMHLNVRGDSSGQGETSRRKQRQQAADPVLNEMETRLRAGLENIDLLDGATIVNNAPHANYVENRFGIFDQLRNFFR